jgi:hypothetical protein
VLFGKRRSGTGGAGRRANGLAITVDRRANRTYRRGGLLAITTQAAWPLSIHARRRALLEIVGFWTPEYVEAKLKTPLDGSNWF